MPGLLLSNPSCTNTTMVRSSSSSSPFSSPSPSPPPHSHRQPQPIFTSTIHHRRTLTRANTSNSGTTTPPLIHSLDFGFSRINHSQNQTDINALSEAHEGEQTQGIESPLSKLEASFFNSWKGESDAETWERMLALQKEYRCYNSARVEAAVEALERGWKIEDMSVRKFILLSFLLLSEGECDVVDLIADGNDIASRLCLNLLNEELRAQIVAEQEMRSQL